VSGQVDDLLACIRERTARDERVLVTTLTKRMAEDLTDYYSELGVRVRYLHSDVETLERVELLRALRAGDYDVLIGINLLREGLDLPEVSLVAILDADKEGFLRSARSLIQTTGRAARNSRGQVIMYADRITPAIKQCMDETERRRAIQTKYNADHGITPETIKRAILEMGPASGTRDYYAVPKGKPGSKQGDAGTGAPELDITERAEMIRQQMFAAAENLEFETAARLRDDLRRLQQGLPPDETASLPSSLSQPPPRAQSGRPKARRAGSPGQRKR